MIKNKALKVVTESLDNSKTSKTANHLIARYSVKLQKIMKLIIDENQPTEISRLKYSKRVTRLYQELSQKTYLLTLNYLEESTGIYPLINMKELEELKQKAITDSERFWKLLELQDPKVKTESFSIGQIFNFLSSSLSGLVYQGVQNTTVTRTRISDSNLNFSEDSPVREREFRMVWVTEDDTRVCPICFPLHGRVYETTDIIPEIPHDTHPNCRCRVVPIDENGNPIL